MTRLIDADTLIRSTIYNPLHVPYIIKSDIEAAPTVDAVPIEFIRSEIINSTGFYNSSLRRLLDAWAERKEE